MSSNAAIAALVAAALFAASTPQAASSPTAVGSRATEKPPPTGDALLVQQLMDAGKGRTRIDSEPTTGKVSFVGFPAGTWWAPRGATDPASVASTFVHRYSTLFGASPKDLGLGRTTRTGQGGGWTVRFAQAHRTVPVFGAELVVELDAESHVVTAAGKLVPLIRAGTDPAVTGAKARSTARESARRNWRHRSADQVDAEAPQVTIYDPALVGRAASSKPTLAWRVKVVGSDEENPRAGFVFVDADTGTTLAQVDLAPTARVRRICDNNNGKTTANAGAATCGSPVRSEGGAASLLPQVNAAYDQLGQVYDFYQSRFGRDGVNNAGQTMNAVVRYCDPQERCPFRNAFWDGTATMVFGDGYATDDITGHEMTHGVTQAMNGLVYSDQSGAINESISDVMGEFIDLTDGTGNDTPDVRWLLGEELPIGALRSMANPLDSLTAQPDSMISNVYYKVALTTACGDTNDSCGVHTNSGVGNKAAYLITDGGTFNGYTVTGLGIDKAAQVYYKAMGLLGPTSRYRDLYNALVQGCTNLVGTAGITAADCAQVKNAVDATRMNLSPTDLAAGAVQNLPACTVGVLPRTDDGSNRVDLPFPVRFGGLQNSLYVNNNGNVTFGAARASAQPVAFGTYTGTPIIAPFLADVDTRAVRSDEVTYGASADGTTFCVNWAGTGVGYYNSHATKLDRFQLLLIDRSHDPEGAAGDFDIVMNYGLIGWDAGDAPTTSNGPGVATVARVGYSAGTGGAGTSVELPGSGVSGSLLDSSSTGLTKGNRASLQPGRYIFRFRDGAAAPAGSISGTVYEGTASAANALDGALVQVCPQSPPTADCSTSSASSAGRYRVSGLAPGPYVVTAFSPATSRGLPARRGPVTVAVDEAVTAQDLVLDLPVPMPNGTDLTTLFVTGDGIPVVDRDAPLILQTHGCAGATASYVLARDGTTLRTGGLAEGPDGTYTAPVPALRPLIGYARATLTLTCPTGPATRIAFDVYIAPSGVVVDTHGHPVAGATVTLFRSDTGGAGPFTAEPAGSGVMSPVNRANPTLATGNGLFGWDIVAGSYRVRAAHDGCTSPTVPGQDYVETPPLRVPPALADLRLVLACSNAPPAAPDRLVATAEDTPSAPVDVVTGSVDPDGDPVTFVSATNGAKGTVACTPAGSCVYTPTADANGADTFTYTVGDGLGGTAVGTVNVAIAPVNDPPTASFTASATSGTAPLTVAFDGAASFDAESTLGYAWTFGDGASAAGAQASHTYSDPGGYVVRLTVTDDMGATAATERTITVNPPIDALTIERTGTYSAAFSGTLRSGDFTIGRSGPAVTAISGTGALLGSRSVTFSLTVSGGTAAGGTASGSITLTNFKTGLVEKIKVTNVRLTVNGAKVGATVTWTVSKKKQQLVWVIDDRRR